MNTNTLWAALWIAVLPTTVLADTVAHPEAGYLGIKVTRSARGLIVTESREDGPAGAVVQPGDVLLAIDSAPIADELALRAVLSATRPGQEIILSLQRAGTRLRVLAVLSAAPIEAPVYAPAVYQQVTREPASMQASQSAPSQLAAPTELVETESVFVLAAPGESRARAISAGLSYTGRKALFDGRFVYEFLPDIALDVRLLTRGDINFLDAGVRITLVREGIFALAARGFIREEHYLDNPRTRLVLGAASPGLMIVLGTPKFHFTIGADLNFYTFAWIPKSNIPGYVGHFATGLHPYIALEYSPSSSIGFFAEFSSQMIEINESGREIKMHGATAGVNF